MSKKKSKYVLIKSDQGWGLKKRGWICDKYWNFLNDKWELTRDNAYSWFWRTKGTAEVVLRNLEKSDNPTIIGKEYKGKEDEEEARAGKLVITVPGEWIGWEVHPKVSGYYLVMYTDADKVWYEYRAWGDVYPYTGWSCSNDNFVYMRKWYRPERKKS